MEDHAFNGLSPVNPKIYRKYGKQNAYKRTLGIVRRTLIIGKPDVLHRG